MNIFDMSKKYPGIEQMIFNEHLRNNKIEQIKLLRKQYHLGLMEAKAIADSFYHVAAQIPRGIQSISPSFLKIYEEAFRADVIGMKEICGAGYRKALEFLIKDYLIKNIGVEKEKIEAMSLGACISKYLDDDLVKKLAHRATWLGNDETHYYRKWKDKDIEDLRKLIDLTVRSLDLKLSADEHLKSMG